MRQERKVWRSFAILCFDGDDPAEWTPYENSIGDCATKISGIPKRHCNGFVTAEVFLVISTDNIEEIMRSEFRNTVGILVDERRFCGDRPDYESSRRKLQTLVRQIIVNNSSIFRRTPFQILLVRKNEDGLDDVGLVAMLQETASACNEPDCLPPFVQIIEKENDISVLANNIQANLALFYFYFE